MSDRTSEELRKRADLEQPEAGTDDMDPGWSPEMTAEEMEDLCDMLRVGADALDRLASVRAKLDKAIAAAPTTTMDNPDVLPTVLDLVDEARALCDGPEGPQIG